MTMRNHAATVELSSVTAGATKYLDWKESDEHTTLVVVTEASATLTVLAGNGIQGAADLAISISAGTHLVRLDSGFYKNTTGTNKGKVGIKLSAAGKVGVAYQI